MLWFKIIIVLCQSYVTVLNIFYTFDSSFEIRDIDILSFLGGGGQSKVWKVSNNPVNDRDRALNSS